MKKTYSLPVLMMAAAGVMLLQSYSNGPANQGFGATGAPGDGPNTCISCHGGGSFGTVNVDVRVLDAGNSVTEYEPLKVYDVEIEVTNSSGAPSGYGFQLLGLKDSDDSNVGGWANPSSNAQITSFGSKDYIEHSSTSATGLFSIEWTAPAEGTGDVTFYGAGNAVNGNGATSGDNPVFGDFTLTEMIMDTVDTNVAVGEINRSRLQIFPNPTNHSITITSDFDRSQVEIINVQGQLVQSVTVARYQQIDVSALEPGIYFVRIAGTQRMERILKL